MKKFKQNLVGKRFGKLLVVSNDNKNSHVQCLCECGSTKSIYRHSLLSGNTKSCGCLMRTFHIKHGATMNASVTKRSPEYRSWMSMKSRCCNKNYPSFKYYGGRGIKICDRWLHSFENFLSDMGPRPSLKHTLDRFPDMNGDYEPSNCRWATLKQQHRNRRNTRLITFNGKTMCIKDWADEIGVVPSVIRYRLRVGKSIRFTLTTKTRTSIRRESNENV